MIKQSIQSLILSGLIFISQPANAMDAIIPQEIHDQVQRVKSWVNTLAEKGEDAYLVLGAANVEIEALEDTSTAHRWAFWNLSTHEGDKSDPNLNPFIDANCNKPEILQYVSNELQNTFKKIIVPEQPIEYMQWKLPEFNLLKNMLVPQGSITFSLNWMGENSTTKNREVPLADHLSSDTINTLNRFDLSYEEREKHISTEHKLPLEKVLGFCSMIYPNKLTATDTTLDLSSLPIEVNSQQVEEYTKGYMTLINDDEYKDMPQQGKALKLMNLPEVRSGDLSYLRLIMSGHYWKKIPFYSEAEAKSYFTRSLLLNTYQKNLHSSYEGAREEWLQREFSKLFSMVKVEDIDRNDRVVNDIPSRTFKLGARVIHLIK